jgi:hypothetical protein
MDDNRYREALEHAEELLDSLAPPEPNWQWVIAHAEAIERVARAEVVRRA